MPGNFCHSTFVLNYSNLHKKENSINDFQLDTFLDCRAYIFIMKFDFKRI